MKMIEYKRFLNASEVLDHYGFNSVPVDVVGLCKTLGISVEESDLTDFENQIGGEKISGILYMDGHGTGKIYVNKDEADVRKRFTIAHELGHYYLHFNGTSGTFVSLRRSRSARETEANRFAAQLLMPDNLLYKESARSFFPSVSRLAKQFDVSNEAMGYRLDDLGLYYVG